MKIVFFEIKNWEEEFIKERFFGHELTFVEETLNSKNALNYSEADCVSVFIYSKVDEKTIQTLSNLKLICTRSTGFDHIDLETAKNKGIKVSNVPYYGENTVAEHTFGLILSMSRKLPESVERTNKADFSREGLRGFDLKGKTFGVIGTGHIGLQVIRIAKGFQMNVLAYDKYPNSEAANLLGFKYCEKDYLLEQSDIISLHAPLNKETEHFINSESIEKMKKGVYIVNTARGGLVKTDSLIKGLTKGIIAGAGLDVLEEETFIDEEIELLDGTDYVKQKKMLENHLLLRMPNVIITPHNAFNSIEALQRILETTIENIVGFEKNNSINLVENA